jgi:hypothetical protein
VEFLPEQLEMASNSVPLRKSAARDVMYGPTCTRLVTDKIHLKYIYIIIFTKNGHFKIDAVNMSLANVAGTRSAGLR